jgi:ABC-type proline/glycine betaine transport system permease subunit
MSKSLAADGEITSLSSTFALLIDCRSRAAAEGQRSGGYSIGKFQSMETIKLRNAASLIAMLLLALLPIQSKTLSQEQQVRGRVVNDAFGFAVTIPPGRTATRVQHITSDAKTLFL